MEDYVMPFCSRQVFKLAGSEFQVNPDQAVIADINKMMPVLVTGRPVNTTAFELEVF